MDIGCSGNLCIVCGEDITVAMHMARACAECHCTPAYYAALRKERDADAPVTDDSGKE